MVLYYTCCDERYLVYAGVDKYENEELIKYHWPEDVWFHVDKHSSAHFYVRLLEGQTINDLPANVINDIAQMTKESSRDGRKLKNVKVIYTMADNLKKTGDMAIGEVGFKDPKAVKYVIVEEKDKEILKRIKKTEREEKVDLKALLEERNRKERERIKKENEKKRKEKQKLIEEKRKEKENKSYAKLFENAKMKTNKFAENDDDVFGDGDDDGDSGDAQDLDDLF